MLNGSTTQWSKKGKNEKKRLQNPFPPKFRYNRFHSFRQHSQSIRFVSQSIFCACFVVSAAYFVHCYCLAFSNRLFDFDHSRGTVWCCLVAIAAGPLFRHSHTHTHIAQKCFVSFFPPMLDCCCFRNIFLCG